MRQRMPAYQIYASADTNQNVSQQYNAGNFPQKQGVSFANDSHRNMANQYASVATKMNSSEGMTGGASVLMP